VIYEEMAAYRGFIRTPAGYFRLANIVRVSVEPSTGKTVIWTANGMSMHAECTIEQVMELLAADGR